MDALARLAADFSLADELGVHPEQMAATFLSFLERNNQWFLLVEDVVLPVSLGSAAAKQPVVSKYTGSASPANQAHITEQPTPDSPPSEQSSSLHPTSDDLYFKLLHCIWTLGSGRVICTSRLRPANNALLKKSDPCLSLDNLLLPEELLLIFERRVRLWSGQHLNQVEKIEIIVFLFALIK